MLRFRRRKLFRLANRLEAQACVRAIAERLVRGQAAAAKSQRLATTQPILFSVRIDDRDVAFDAKRAIVKHCDFHANEMVTDWQSYNCNYAQPAHRVSTRHRRRHCADAFDAP